jgi:threonylcarbamoyladenosine tRNA methylthiotransferase MtaB
VNRFFMYTFGCRCNQADSAGIRASLSRSSMEETDCCRDAELVVVNSCTVTHRTDQQVRQMVRRLCRENPGARVVVTGCYAERDPEALASIQGVDLVVGNFDKQRLDEIVLEYEEPCSKRIIRSPLDSLIPDAIARMSRTGGKTRPFIKLQDGCDARCSYCIVPLVRGPGKSARPEEILDEIRELVRAGFKEIVLTGVHLGSYGRKLTPRVRLVDLLVRILEIRGLGRLRLSSLEPMRFQREIVLMAAENPIIAPHFHIPLQSGSNKILRRMRRPYTAGYFLDLLEYIHAILPNAAIGSDIIVGFPGETDSDFHETCELVDKAPLTYLHVFPFSAREKTDAFSMPDAVSSGIIKERSRILGDISRRKNLAFRRRFLGSRLPALTLAKEEAMGERIALTENYIHTRLNECGLPPNRLVTVRIDSVQGDRTAASIAD